MTRARSLRRSLAVAWLFSLAGLVGLAGCSDAPLKSGIPTRTEIAVRAEPLPLNPSNPSEVEIGQLRYVGGWHLTADHPAFGGFSALDVRGDTLTMISDAGTWFTARLTGGEGNKGNAALLADTVLAPYQRLPDSPDGVRRPHDVEDMTFTPPAGYLVSREDIHQIERFLVPGDRAVPVPGLGAPVFDFLPANGGFEAISLDGDGRLILIAERGMRDGTAHGWVSDLAGNKQDFFLVMPPQHAPTSAAMGSDGMMYMTARRYSVVDGVSIAVMRFNPKRVPGTKLVPEEIARITPPNTIDNIEGIAATVNPHGGVRLWLVSDDNFAALQRTVFLVFDVLP